MIERLRVEVPGAGLHEFTADAQRVVSSSGLREGLCSFFLQHTSASLLIQENADPSAKRDLERWLERLVPEGDPLYTHTAEGPDDMPAHIKAALTQSTLSVPVVDGRLGLGVWQGLFLWEHRRGRASRNLLIHLNE